MDVIMVIAVGVGSGIFGLIAGYVIRWALTAGKRGSVELEVKQLLLGGKEDAQRIIQDAEKKAARRGEELRAQEKEKEREWKKTEDRLVKKEELLDQRQGDIDREV